VKRYNPNASWIENGFIKKRGDRAGYGTVILEE